MTMAIHVLEAFYGNSEDLVNVTGSVQSLCDDPEPPQGVSFTVDYNSFGIPDPNPGVRKSFMMKYQTDTFHSPSPTLYRLGCDGQVITIPYGNSGNIFAVRAIYGTVDQYYDITERFNQFLYLNPDVNSITIDQNFLNKFCYGSDIDHGTVKSLFLELTDQQMAVNYTLCAHDGETITWPF